MTLCAVISINFFFTSLSKHDERNDMETRFKNKMMCVFVTYIINLFDFFKQKALIGICFTSLNNQSEQNINFFSDFILKGNGKEIFIEFHALHKEHKETHKKCMHFHFRENSLSNFVMP